MESKNVHDEMQEIKKEIGELKEKVKRLESTEVEVLNISNKKLNEYKTITVKIDKSIHEDLNKFVKEEGYTIQTVINAAIEQFLNVYFEDEIEI